MELLKRLYWYCHDKCSFIGRLPSLLRPNLCILWNALQGKYIYYDFVYGQDSPIVGEEKVREFFHELDSESIELACRFMSRQTHLSCSYLLVRSELFFTPEELRESRRIEPEVRKTERRYGLPFMSCGPESLYYHHGLKLLPDSVLSHLKGSVFIDAGGFYGESAIIFRQYDPRCIFIFEPETPTRKKLVKMLKKNHFSSEEYRLLPYGLAERSGETGGMECVTLDSLEPDFQGRVGMIKADIEGMGRKMLLGAEQVVRKHRPLLSLSIYHCADEFFGIYETLQNWNLNYRMKIVELSPGSCHGEYSLLAWPEEWEKAVAGRAAGQFQISSIGV